MIVTQSREMAAVERGFHPWWGHRLRGELLTLVLFSLVVAMSPKPALAAVQDVANACNVLVTGPGGGGVMEVVPGDTVRLVGPMVHHCTPTFDHVTGALRRGNGIIIRAQGTSAAPITLDLNGRSIRSTANVAMEAAALGLATANAGVTIEGEYIRITNSRLTAVSIVENFTINFDIATCGSCKLVARKIDHDGLAATPTVYNVVSRKALVKPFQVTYMGDGDPGKSHWEGGPAPWNLLRTSMT